MTLAQSGRQDGLWERAVALADAGRLPHALLLAGPRGTGKLAFARALAAHLVCEAPDRAQKPCGACRGCIQREAGTHPNLMVLAPAEDKRDIAIDDIRNLLSRLSLSAHYGGRKIAIVAPADALNIAGINALLKTIEEPPPATHIVLVAERWRALPATLRSRCQILRFAPARGTPAVANGEGEGEGDAQWSRALAELAQGRFAPLALVQGFKRDDAQRVLEAFLHVGARWLKGLVVPGQVRASGVPPQVTAAAVEALIDQALEGLKALDRVSAVLVLESIMIRWAGRTA